MLTGEFNIQHEFVTNEDIVVLEDENGRSPTYRYKNPIEYPVKKGFYLIPGFSMYLINHDGDLFSIRKHQLLKWTTIHFSNDSRTGGYQTANVENDRGARQGVSRHRLMMLVFTEYDFHPATMWVNHINGIPGDDRLVNLEWVTPGQNVKHAYDNGLHPNKVVAVDVVNWISGYENSFDSIQSACNELGLNSSTIQSRLTYGNHKRYDDGWRFKRSDEEWKVLNGRVKQSSQEVEVIARDSKTGKTCIFPSVSKTADYTKVKAGTIQRHCVDEIVTPFNGWNFRYVRDFKGWPIYTDKHIMLFDKFEENEFSDGIIVYDDLSDEEVFFGTQTEAAIEYGLSKITIVKIARHRKVRDGLRFELFRIRECNLSEGPM